MKAYVFVNVAAGKSGEVADQLRSVPGVKSADICWGLPDIVALVEVGDSSALLDLVLGRIQKIAGVSQTDTHIVTEA
jgi:translation elongation factor EF-1beta